MAPHEFPERYRVQMVWPEGSETVVIEEGMIVNRDNLLRLNPELKDHPNLGNIGDRVTFYAVQDK